MLTTVGLSNLPDAIRRRDTIAGPDYVDLFTAVTPGTTDKSAEDWARALLEDTPTGRSGPLLAAPRPASRADAFVRLRTGLEDR